MVNKKNTEQIKGWGGARKGSGRSSLFKGEKKQKITLSFTNEAVKILDEKSETLGYSRSDILNKLILDKL